jgi:predicted amidohydrolase YtcJ
MTRRVRVLAAAALAASLALAAPEKAGQADRIFVGGRVWTGEPGRPLADALAIRGTTVLAVGANADLRKLSGKGTEIVDLRGRFVAPGFSQDLLAIPPQRIKDTKVLLTVLGGQDTWRAREF